MGKKRPLFRSRRTLPLTTINNVKAPVEGEEAPISRVLKTKTGRPRRVQPPGHADPPRSASLPETSSDHARAADEVRSIRGARGTAARAKKRPTRHRDAERATKSAESSLSVAVEKENVDGRGVTPLPSSSVTMGSGGTEHGLGRYVQQARLRTESGTAAATTTWTTRPEVPKKPFLAAKTFQGTREGYVYKHGKFGLGYYVDQLPKLQGQMCAHAMVDLVVDQCMEGVARLALIKARRAVNALVDTAVEISHHRSEVHWYENMAEERGETMAENLGFAERHDRTRWESWEPLAAELLRLRTPEYGGNAPSFVSPRLRSTLAEAHGKSPADVAAILELLEDCEAARRRTVSVEHSARVLAKYRISPRALRGLCVGLNYALKRANPGRGVEDGEEDEEIRGKAGPSICQRCTELRGRRLCAMCARSTAVGEATSGTNGSPPPSCGVCVRQNSYGSLLYSDWSWWESRGIMAQGESSGSPAEWGGLPDSLLDMVYALQSKATRRIFNAWRIGVSEKKATRSRDRLAAAKLVAGVFRKWKKLVEIRKEQRQDGIEVTGKPEKSSYMRSFTTASSSMLSVGEKLKLAS